MKNRILKENLNSLRDRPMGVDLSRLLSVPPKDIKIFNSQNRTPTFTYSGRYIHSKIDPISDGIRFADSLGAKEGDCILLYGFGVGYHVEPILNIIGEKGKLIVLEFNRNILAAALSIRSLSSIISADNFWLIGGGSQKDVASRFLSFTDNEWGNIDDSRKKVAVYSPSYQSIPAGYKDIKEAFELFLMERRYVEILGDKSNSNVACNKQIIKKSAGVARFFGRYKGQNGLLVGSGPSLDETIRYLKYFSPDTVVIAADSALSALLNNGIKVNFVISVDPQDKTYNHLKDVLDAEVPLIFMPNTNPAILKDYRGKKYVVFRSDHDTPHLYKDKGVTDGGGSVSCVGLDLLIRFGVNRIFLSGIDSSFPGGRYYANEIGANIDFMDNIGQYLTLGQIHKGIITRQERVKTANRVKGIETVTHRNLYSYQRTIEQMISLSKGVSFYRLGGNHVSIAGIKNITKPYSGELGC